MGIVGLGRAASRRERVSAERLGEEGRSIAAARDDASMGVRWVESLGGGSSSCGGRCATVRGRGARIEIARIKTARSWIGDAVMIRALG